MDTLVVFARAAALLLFGLLITVLKLIVESHRAKLSHIPGPLLARYTDVWRFHKAWRIAQTQEEYSGELVKRYGDVVRIGPTTVAVFDPAAIPTIYGTQSRLAKGDGYMAFAAPGVTTSLLTSLDEQAHAKYKRPVAHAYSLSALKFYEPNVDKIINQLIAKLAQMAENSEVTNISKWCHFYAYDVVGQLTFGQPLGFLETGEDVHGMVEVQKKATFYATTASQLPWLDRLFKRTARFHKLGSGGFSDFVRVTVEKRLQTMPKYESGESKPDLLSQFASVQGKYPDIMTAKQLVILTAGNLFAGSQSPSYVLDTIFNWLARNQDAQRKLYAEFKQTESQGACPITWQRTQSMPYLDGIVQEGYRLHGGSFFVLERVTPALGLTLPSGHHLPPGIKVGGTTSGFSRRASSFGKDATEFKPERWMRSEGEGEIAYAKRRKMMDTSGMKFGHGSRMCIGKSIADMEIYKVVATLVGLFEFELVGQPKPFEVNVIVRRREM